jgi:hypothetical protein
VALPDSIPVILNNPANLAQLRHLTGFLSVDYSSGNLEHVSNTNDLFDSYHFEKHLSMGLAALSLPLMIKKLPVTLAASYNGTMPYGHKLGVTYKRSGTSRSASLGLAVQLAARFRIGVGGTHRFGEYDTKTFDGLTDYFFTNRTVQYSGTMYHIGLQNDIAQRFALGVVYYFPAPLEMKVKTYYSHVSGDISYKYKSQIPAALRIGLGYRFSTHGTLGVGYGYQWLKGSHSDLSSFSAGIEYKFRLNTIIFPLYVKYEHRSVPSYAGEFISFSSEKKATCHILGLGGGIQWQAFTLYFASQWSQCASYEVSIMPAPPWS